MTFEKQCIIMTTGLRLKKKTTEFGVGEFKTLYSWKSTPVTPLASFPGTVLQAYDQPTFGL